MTGVPENLLFYILPFLVVVGVVVTVHEFGHFLAAKALGTKIDQFSIGFGKAFAHWTDKSGVEWRLGWAPVRGLAPVAGGRNAPRVPAPGGPPAPRPHPVARHGRAPARRPPHLHPPRARARVRAT